MKARKPDALYDDYGQAAKQAYDLRTFEGPTDDSGSPDGAVRRPASYAQTP